MTWTDSELKELEDPDTWDWDSAQVHHPGAARGTVVSVRFETGDFDRVSREAERLGLTVTDFIRTAALARAEATARARARKRKNAPSGGSTSSLTARGGSRASSTTRPPPPSTI